MINYLKKGENSMKRTVALLLSIMMVISLASCKNDDKKIAKNAAKYNMELSYSKPEYKYKFSGGADTSQILKLSEKTKSLGQKEIKGIRVNCAYEDLFETEKAYEYLMQREEISSHKYSALDKNGNLSAEHLVETVKKNNKDYLKENDITSDIISEPDDDFLNRLCKLITDTVNVVFERNPSIDKDRVYCNLGALKILYKKSMLDNAAVDSELVLNISPTMFEVVDIMEDGGFGCRDVIVHEVMHIVQMGCLCEDRETVTLHCGIAQSREDFEVNTAYISWLCEGSAERYMQLVTGDELTTYKNMVNYVCTMDITKVPDEDAKSDFAETVNFYNDPEILFKGFHCETPEERYEFLNMLISMDLMQMQPDELLKAYGEKYGVDVSKDDVKDKLFYDLKPEILLTFSKEFYYNLLEYTAKGNATLNDVCGMIGLFESALSYHLGGMEEKAPDALKRFTGEYKKIRNIFFETVNRENGIDLEKIYSEYSVVKDENKVNASFKSLSDDKKDFILERMTFLDDWLDKKIK